MKTIWINQHVLLEDRSLQLYCSPTDFERVDHVTGLEEQCHVSLVRGILFLASLFAAYLANKNGGKNYYQKLHFEGTNVRGSLDKSDKLDSNCSFILIVLVAHVHLDETPGGLACSWNKKKNVCIKITLVLNLIFFQQSICCRDGILLTELVCFSTLFFLHLNIST